MAVVDTFGAEFGLDPEAASSFRTKASEATISIGPRRATCEYEFDCD